MSATSPSPVNNHNERKRKRLTFACNSCRSRKVRCDDRQPTCTNCLKAGIYCVTTDPRQPGNRVERREAQQPSPNLSISPTIRHNEVESSVLVTGESGSLHTGVPQPITALAPIARTTQESYTTINEDSRPPTPTSVSSAPLPLLPRIFSGNSLQVLTQWLDLAFLRIGIPLRFSSQHSIDPLIRKPSKSSALLSSPPTHYSTNVDVAIVGKSYNSSFNVVYPLFDQAQTFEILQDYSKDVPQRSSINLSSSSAVALLIVAIAGSNDRGQMSHNALDLIRVAYSLTSSIIAEASLRSTQALFLMAFVFRGYNEIELAWHLTTVAVTISQTLGMHRRIAAPRRVNLGEALSEEYVRTWWSIYHLDKMLSLEVERPSSVRDSECNQSMPKLKQDPPIFEGIIKLAQIQSQISNRSIQARSSEESKTKRYDDIIREKLTIQGELDQLLVLWDESLPSELRPSNHLYCDPKLLPQISFMAVQYYQTLALLYRNTLLINLQHARKEIDLYCAGQPYLHRLRSGQAICGNAARSIVNVLSNVYEHQAESILNTVNAPLVAAYALAIYTLKSPSSGLARSDLELLAQAISLVKRQKSLTEGHDLELESLLGTLQSQVSAVVQGSNIKTHARGHEPPTRDRPVPGHGNVAAASTDQQYSNLPFSSFSTLLPKDQTLPENSLDLSGAYNPFAAMELPDFFGSTSVFFDTPMNTSAMDWDAIAAALDLPES